MKCKKMKLECLVNRSLQTLLDEDVEYVIHRHHLSPVGDFSKNGNGAGEGTKREECRKDGRGGTKG